MFVRSEKGSHFICFVFDIFETVSEFSAAISGRCGVHDGGVSRQRRHLLFRVGSGYLSCIPRCLKVDMFGALCGVPFFCVKSFNFEF